MTITCFACGNSCTGEVLKVQERHFHLHCFICKVCSRPLASGGYFMKKDDYYCSKDYHKMFGTKCKACGEYVEGRVVTALGHSYHPHCFTCDRCKEEIRSGTVVTYNDRQEILCQKCTDLTLNDENDGEEEESKPASRTGKTSDRPSSSQEGSSQSDSYPSPLPREPVNISILSDQSGGDLFDFSKVPDIDSVTRAHMGKCAGCSESIRSCQSLIALERHWHLFCFTCFCCKKLLTSEYLNKGDKPYCESCFHDQFGVPCVICREFITGKVLEAGEKSFHPSCATCCKCGLTFGEGEDMCMAGEDIWHLDCDKVRAEAGIRTDSEGTSSEGSRSRTQSATTPSPTGHEHRSFSSRSFSKLHMSRESSAGEPSQKRVYPLKALLLIGSTRLPKGVNRTKLEEHLSDEDFYAAFKMSRHAFYCMQKWKQIDMKKRAHLF